MTSSWDETFILYLFLRWPCGATPAIYLMELSLLKTTPVTWWPVGSSIKTPWWMRLTVYLTFWNKPENRDLWVKYIHQEKENCHDANFVITVGGVVGCRCDNLWCHYWRQSEHWDNFWFHCRCRFHTSLNCSVIFTVYPKHYVHGSRFVVVWSNRSVKDLHARSGYQGQG